MALGIENGALLLLIASVVAIIARRLDIPYSVGLILVGIAAARLLLVPDVALTRELLFGALLPPLIFEASLYIRWRDLRLNLPLILVLATAGVLLSAAVTAIGMHFVAGWELTSAALFGALIAATDPVSVIATFKDADVRGRLRLLVEAESLFNDGGAAVLFSITLAIAGGGSAGIGEVIAVSAITVAGGVVCGCAVAALVLLLAGSTHDHLVEMMLTTIAAYGSFLLAERIHASGVLATLVAGLLVGNVGPLRSLSEKGREAVVLFWEYVAFIVNSLIFILIGVREASQDFGPVLPATLAAIVLVTISRAAAVYPLCLLFARSPLRVPARYQHVLFWGGLRGALALALALGLPPEIPRHDELVTITFGVVAFSIVTQGLTIKPFLRRLGGAPHHL
jgi:CPA1 family monovalent cation:H+ antiporter